ncbi:4-alpha-glucanotransferase [Pseudonocardia sp. DSM 110487]|uniref:4-alpha-glucanotransferase n=1 Tax=Pseudonocardia sp. DSM 110487 TaxID=2865833 RepID=UPI001C6A8C10|nr:4-alpha-glucanotransferase [Pseudonocardia sp. DSM 110487]QYN36296.1 4-alpha-glucanotransferase [Pseudonocardia sp. DSM 110487]
MDSELIELATAHGVATSYRDGDRRPVQVDPEVVVRVLGLLDVDAGSPDARRGALAAARERAASGRLPGTIAVRTDSSRALPEPGVLVDAAGERREVTEIPAGLEPGWYRLELGAQDVTVVVAPPALPEPSRGWGWMLQLYALRSAGSWGIGDLGDLRAFTAWTGAEHGAGAVLLNPLHAITPVPPVQPSPYTPSSRRFGTPLALRITDLSAYARTDSVSRAEVDALRPEFSGGRIEHDRVWAAKRAALELLWRSEGRPEPRGIGADLEEFATYCALAERHGARWSRWPEGLRTPGGTGVAAAKAELAPRIAFHAWVQLQVQDQLAAVRDAARAVGVRVVHDLAVGCDPEGADGWALQDVLAQGVRVGAPPDAFSQQGQDWGLPPWRPDRLDATGYAAYRDLLRALLRQADGLRIDHVSGLWRLWWVPPGERPDRGTYVHYDADVMLAVLTLEAHLAGALVIGEDLGTVEPEVTEGIAERNILGSSVLWFTRDLDAPGQPLLPPQKWPEQSVATISTHDLPTATGFLRGEHVRVRAELGLLDDVPAEEAKATVDRLELVELLREEGLVDGPDPGEDQLVVAMHALLARSRSRLALVSPYDVVGEVRQPNLPGTIDEYPNWRLPLPVTLEELRDDPRVRVVVDQLRLRRGGQDDGHV